MGLFYGVTNTFTLLTVRGVDDDGYYSRVVYENFALTALMFVGMIPPFGFVVLFFADCGRLPPVVNDFLCHANPVNFDFAQWANAYTSAVEEWENTQARFVPVQSLFTVLNVISAVAAMVHTYYYRSDLLETISFSAFLMCILPPFFLVFGSMARANNYADDIGARMTTLLSVPSADGCQLGVGSLGWCAPAPGRACGWCLLT